MRDNLKRVQRPHFTDINDAREIIDQWRGHYDEERPHGSLGYLTPKSFEH